MPTVTNHLIENAEFIADTVADGGDIECGQRVHIAGRQPAEPPVAEAGLLFLLEDSGQILPYAGKRLASLLPDPEIDKAVAQMRSHQELSREICNTFIRNVHTGNFGGAHTVVHHSVANRVRERHIPVVTRRVLHRNGLHTVQVINHRLGERFRFESGATVCLFDLIGRGGFGFRADTGTHISLPIADYPLPSCRGTATVMRSLRRPFQRPGSPDPSVSGACRRT